jgi:purine-nucleoside phosphorylase
MSTPAQSAAEIVKSRNGLGMTETAIVLGRNFYSVADVAENETVIPYSELPGFPQGVEGGELILCVVDGIATIFLKGRTNFHETGDPSLMATPFETLARLGVRSILTSSFAQSTRADIVPSSVVAVTDHINFNGFNPLVGAPGDKNSVNMNEAYDKRLLRRLKQAAGSGGVTLHEGVMMWFSGPSFETPAEVKMTRTLGADLIGWSIAPEAILARRFGVPFAGVAVITDFGAGFSNGAPNADATRGPAVAGVIAVKRLARAFIRAR